MVADKGISSLLCVSFIIVRLPTTYKQRVSVYDEIDKRTHDEIAAMLKFMYRYKN